MFASLSSKCLHCVCPLARPCVLKVMLTRTSGLQVSTEFWSRLGGLAIRSESSCLLYTVMHASRTPVPSFSKDSQPSISISGEAAGIKRC